MARFWTLINGTVNHVTDTPVNKTLNLEPEDWSSTVDHENQDTVHSIQISDFDASYGSTLSTSLSWKPSKGKFQVYECKF